MYKENQTIKTFEKTFETLNIESVGKRSGCYKYYSDCGACKNQSIADDEGTHYSCNNVCEVNDITDTKIYCKNYVLDREQARKYRKQR